MGRRSDLCLTLLCVHCYRERRLANGIMTPDSRGPGCLMLWSRLSIAGTCFQGRAEKGNKKGLPEIFFRPRTIFVDKGNGTCAPVSNLLSKCYLRGRYVVNVIDWSLRSILDIRSPALSLHSGNQDKKVAIRPRAIFIHAISLNWRYPVLVHPARLQWTGYCF